MDKPQEDLRDRPIHSRIIRSDDKELVMLAVNLRGSGRDATLPAKVQDIFDELAPFMKRDRQVAFTVDDKEGAIDGKHAAGTSRLSEVDISVPQWPADELEPVDA